MALDTPWSFYGRRSELQQMLRILERRRWFFLQISGRRRIGKTALIQEALRGAGIAKTLYVQIPDSDPAGVVAACNGYLETFGIEARVAEVSGGLIVLGSLHAEMTALHEQGVLHAERRPLLHSLFFSSSSPLRNEADNWFASAPASAIRSGCPLRLPRSSRAQAASWRRKMSNPKAWSI